MPRHEALGAECIVTIGAVTSSYGILGSIDDDDRVAFGTVRNVIHIFEAFLKCTTTSDPTYTVTL
jgi:hypothetical protein